MGLFKKHNHDEYEEDFILDFEHISTRTAPKDDKSKQSTDSEFGITPWEQRKHHSAPHAMTPDEILGKEKESPKASFSDVTIASGFNENSKEIKNDDKDTGDDIFATRSFSVPSDATPKFSAGEHHAETDVIPASHQETKQKLKNQADELLLALHQRNKASVKAEETVAESKPTPKAEQPTEKIISDKQPISQPTASQTQAVTEEKPTARRDSNLSPKAQELYDRMMAERAKGRLNRIENEIYNKDKPVVTAPVAKAEPVVTEAPKQTEPALPVPDVREGESTADAIFETLNDSLNNPLRKRENESLLSKCKNFVTQEIPINPERSIDDIIHEAELGARQRLSDFYQSGEFAVPTSKPQPKYNFDMFNQSHIAQTETPDAIDGDTRVINLDSFTEKSTFKEDVGKEVKNLQYSLADEPTPPAIDATRVIEIEPQGHQADPIKAAEWRKHLEVLAEQEPEEAPERMHLSGTDEPELPDAQISDFPTEAPPVDDYETIEDAESIRTDLKSQSVSVTARIIPTTAITVILAICDFVFKDALLASPTTFILLNLVLLGLALIINLNTIRGLLEIFTGTPDMDSPAALSSTMVFVYTLVTALTDKIAELPILAPIGAIVLLFNLIGKRSMLKRVYRGFSVIATDTEKKAVTFIEDSLSASVMAGGSVVGEALVTIGKSTKNVTGYLKNAYSEDAYEKHLNTLTVFTLVMAVVLATAAFFTNGLFGSLLAFTLVCCVACPTSSLLICNLPFGIASKKLKSYGAMLAGYTSADDIANANAVAFDVGSLFPAGSIKLYNMQVLNRGAVDKYIASAAALLTAAHSPLAPIFEEILESNGEEMPIIDSIKYENNMGLSGWIEDKRIFVGNRTLMEGHSIKTPSLELDKKILRQGYFPVYLGIGDQLCALFIVGYEADEQITYELRRLCNTGVTMLVNSNDPNVCDEMLCDYFGLYPDSIKVLSPSGSTAYKSAVSFKEKIASGASFGENICGLLSILTAAINLKSIISTLLIINTILVCLGIAAVGYLALSGMLTALSGILVAGVSLIPAAITALVAYLKQP